MREKVTVQLMERDRQIAKKLIEDRLKSFRKNRDWDIEKNSYGVSAYDRQYTCLMGELAFAEYADLTIDSNEYRWTDGGSDFQVKYNGTTSTIDVKTANKEPYALFVKDKNNISADYYVQGYLDNLTVTFVGMATGETVRAQELVDTPYDHQNHEVPIAELQPIPEPEALKPIGSN